MNRLLLEVEPGIKSVSGWLTKIADRPQTERNGVLAILLIGDVLAPKGELKGTVRTYRHCAYYQAGIVAKPEASSTASGKLLRVKVVTISTSPVGYLHANTPGEPPRSAFFLVALIY